MTRRGCRALCAGLALVWLGPARADAPRLIRDLAREASVIVIAAVVKTKPYAEGRLLVHTLEVAHAIKGEPPETLAVLEERRTSLRLFDKGERVLAFLGAAPDHSFYRQNLPAGRYLAAVAGSEGVVEIEQPADAWVRSLIAAYAGEDGDERALLRRELRSGHSRFAADAAAQLESGPDLASQLAEDDLEALRVCLRDPAIDDQIKARLVHFLGDGTVPGALGMLRQLQPSSGIVIAARGEALARLGQPPGWGEIEAYLKHPDPAVRSFGLKRLAASPHEEVVERLEAVALRDRADEVRIAAIEALGETRRPEAARSLQRTFDSQDVELRRASAQALHQLGGPAAQEALGDLVLASSHYEVQAHALVLLFALGAQKDDAVIDQILREHPDPRIRRVIEEGIDLRPPSHPGK